MVKQDMENANPGGSANAFTPLSLEQQILWTRVGLWGLLLGFCLLVLWSAFEAESFALWLGKAAFGIALFVYMEGVIWLFYRKLLRTREIRNTYSPEEQFSLELQETQSLLKPIKVLSLGSWLLLALLQSGAALANQRWAVTLINVLFYGACFVVPVLRIPNFPKRNEE